MALRVLVIDDNESSRALLRAMIVALGHQMVAEADGMQQALEAYKKHRPNVVTLDLSMPGEDGMVVLKALRALDPQAKVIIVSANSQMKLYDALLSAGACGFLIKPASLEELEDLLAKTAARAGISEAQSRRLRQLLEEGAARCAGSLTKMSRVEWNLEEFSVGETLRERVETLLSAYGPDAGRHFFTMNGGAFLVAFPRRSGMLLANRFSTGFAEGIDGVLKPAPTLAEISNIIVNAFITSLAKDLGDIVVSPPKAEGTAASELAALSVLCLTRLRAKALSSELAVAILLEPSVAARLAG